MIHFPDAFVSLLKRTAETLKLSSSLPFDQLLGRVLSTLELDLHAALFCTRKIQESVGVPLDLEQQTLLVSCWPITQERKREILATPNPPLEKWYQLTTSHGQRITYQQVIEIFIHARLCNFVHFIEDHENAIVVSSDHTMRERLYLIRFTDLSKILLHAVSIFQPVVERRRNRGSLP